MKNPTKCFREMNLVLKLVQELGMKSKTEMSWSPRKKKSAFFVTFILSEGNTCVWFISMHSVLNKLSVYTFTCQKNINS